MIEISHLDFAYDGTPLFRGLDIEFRPGNIYGLLGLNGAGKTTLLRLITGLLFADAGGLRSLGHDPAEREPGFLSQVYLLPEEFNVPGITDRQYVAALAPLYPRFDLAAFERYVTEFALPRGKKLTALSYGQKKKFLLSFGLATRSGLLVLDEPSNGLDIPSKGLFRRLVAEAATDDRIVIISTHQVRDVESLIDPIVILHQGRVLFNHGMSEITARIRMSHDASRPPANATGLLYCEPAIGGYWTVWADDSAAEGQIDLEVLFNTVISAPDAYRSVFARRGEAA